MTIKGRFERFTRKIRPTEGHIEKANQQTAFMKDRLHDRVADDGSFELEKILLAGSNAKHTSLRKTKENRFDVDLNAYYSGKGAKKQELDRLLHFTRDRLVEIYPQKGPEDFEVLRSAVRVKFTSGIQLWVDVAPIIKDDSLGIENAGWIPRPDGWRLTSVTAHNQFVIRRTQESKEVPGPVHFNRLVRLVKWWNNRQGELMQPSIFCELITAAAVAQTGVTSEWQSSLRQVFTFLRKHQLRKPIIFADNYDPRGVAVPCDPVVVLDSVNPANNVTAEWTLAKREAFLDAIQGAYDSMMAALAAEQTGDEDLAVDCWCEVFGSQFRTLSEKEEDLAVTTTRTRAATQTGTHTKIVYVARKIHADFLAILDTYGYFSLEWGAKVMSDVRELMAEEVIDEVYLVWTSPGTNFVLDAFRYRIIVAGIGEADARSGNIRYKPELAGADFNLRVEYNSRWWELGEEGRQEVQASLQLPWGPGGRLDYSGGRWDGDRTYSKDGYGAHRDRFVRAG